MGLEVVVGDVLAKGKEEANRIVQDGIDEANAVIAEAENAAHQLLVERREQTAEQIDAGGEGDIKHSSRRETIDTQYPEGDP